MARPTITLKPQQSDKGRYSNERIFEFFDSELQLGGLIAIRRTEKGLIVEPYRLDHDVTVLRLLGSHLPPKKTKKKKQSKTDGQYLWE